MRTFASVLLLSAALSTAAPALGQSPRFLGQEWEPMAAPAPFGERYLHRGAVFNDQLVISGGFNDSVMFMDDVWSSPDGAKWSCLVEDAPWAARFGHGMVALGDHLYLMGGYSGDLHNDVWRSSNGKGWELLTDSAPWAPRSDFQVLKHGEQIILLGGRGKGQRLADVWSSADGESWTRLSENAWPRRSHFAAASHNGQIVVATGLDFDFDADVQRYHRDVWTSPDGRDWTLVNDRVPMRGRSLMQMVSSGRHIYAMGGDDIPLFASMRKDIWATRDGVDWMRLAPIVQGEELIQLEFDNRINFVLLAKEEHLFVIGGHQLGPGRFSGVARFGDAWRNDDVWRSTGPHVPEIVPAHVPSDRSRR